MPLAAVRNCWILLILITTIAQAQNWPQGSGPNGNWSVEGENPPTSWSVSTGENILWRTPLPESGQGTVVVWGDRIFVTANIPWGEDKELAADNKAKPMGTDIDGYCLNAKTGEILWKVRLPGTRLKLYGGPFSDSTAPSPITDGKHVWFYNVSGMIGCYDFDGKEIWTHSYTPRGIMANRQFEPLLVGDVILNIEVLDKSTVIDKRSLVDNDTVKKLKREHGNKNYFTYIHAYDKLTGELKWISEDPTSTHSASCLGTTKDGQLAVLHGRGGGHHPIDQPPGLSLTSLAPGSEGKTLWQYKLKTGSEYTHQWNSKYATWWIKGHHVVLDATTGKLVRNQPLTESVAIREYDATAGEYVDSKNDTLNIGAKVTTHYSNLLVGDYQYFRTYGPFFVGRVHLETGETEYLQVPFQAVREKGKDEQLLWGKRQYKGNDTKNSRGIDAGAVDKRSKGNGWGHISAAPPIRVGSVLYIPTMIGTTYVIDTAAKRLDEKALLSVSDLGPAGKTWTLSSFSYSNGRLYHRTMKEVICIGSE
jgi:outer membrane protein assembly factor BamB